jgi:hypothetical protein
MTADGALRNCRVIGTGHRYVEPDRTLMIGPWREPPRERCYVVETHDGRWLGCWGDALLGTTATLYSEVGTWELGS